MYKLILLLLVLPIMFVSAQAETISGLVTDVDGNPLTDVNIAIGSVHYRPTDDRGKFSIELDDPESKSITFTHIGFKPLMMRIGQKKTLYARLQRSIYRTEGITVHASRDNQAGSARAYDNFTSEDIERDYLIGEFPLLLESTPNLYSFADAGGGLGYSYLRIRGFDDKRISVYINGVPLNDPEDQATYFVDIPDFAAEVTDIQVERGVGSSSYGDAAFGGTINIVSAALDRERKTSFSTGYGGYTSNGKIVGDMRKQAVDYSSGLVDGQWNFSGRYSKLYSDGYRENSWYDGWSYYLSVSRLDPGMVTTFNTYGGPMRMHLAYYGSDRETLKKDRRYNYLKYENETDNFNQPHYELHNTYQIDGTKTLTNTLFYIRGKGYYEQFKDDKNYGDYNIPPIVIPDGSGNPVDTITSGDLVRQQWVVKDQVGLNSRLDIKHSKGNHYIGGAFYLFDSNHWGQVVWAEGLSSNVVSPRHKYYEYFGDKFSGSVYAGEDYNFTDRFGVSLKLQTRYIQQSLDQTPMGAFKVDNDYSLSWFFVSPRVALKYKPTRTIDLSASAAISSRSPADWVIYDANDPDAIPSLDIKPERVYDFELGGKYQSKRARLDLNLYWMELRNEIVPSGGLDDLGLPITANADRSVHAGVETAAAVNVSDMLSLESNFSVTYDRARDFIIEKPLYDNDQSWNQIDGIKIDYSDNPLAGFPTYLGNLIADFKYNKYRVTGRGRLVGRQYIENSGNNDASIDPYATLSISASVALAAPAGIGRFVLSGRVDNLFNKKYETSGFYDEYYFRDSPDIATGYYIPAAERSFFVQVKLELD